jgi:hypothetical protein
MSQARFPSKDPDLPVEPSPVAATLMKPLALAREKRSPAGTSM